MIYIVIHIVVNKIFCHCDIFMNALVLVCGESKPNPYVLRKSKPKPYVLKNLSLIRTF